MTGSTGLIGRAVLARLGRDGHEGVGLSRSGENGLAIDLGQAGAASEITRAPRCEAIVHAAAAIAAPDAEVALTNCLGTQAVLEVASDWETSRFVFLSSLPVIGRPLRLPITEEHPVDPPTPYHASKLYGERLVALAGASGLAGVSLRVTAPVGPGMPENRILPTFLRRALAGEPLEVAGQGTRRQDYVDVRDVAEAVSACLEHRPTGVLNIGSGRAISNLELARTCAEATGSSSAIRLGLTDDADEGLHWEVSIDRAAARIGYRPRYSLTDTIRHLAAGLGAHV